MKKVLFLTALAFAGCGGGGGTTPPTLTSVTVTPSPSQTPVTSLTVAPTPTCNPAFNNPPGTFCGMNPTPPPVFIFKTIGGAPLTATASQLSTARRTAQAHTQAQGSTNGLPVLVESSGMAGAWAGDQAVWVTNTQTSADIPETSGTITATNNLPLDNPGFAQACVGSLAPACIVHPTAWEYGTVGGGPKPVGKQTLTVAFGDGTMGTTYDYIYDGWALQCNTGFVYQAGIPVATSTKAASDVFADCVAGNMVFPQGAILAFNPVQDQFGRFETIMPTITSAILMSSLITNVPMTATTNGQVLGIATRDGGFAKVYMNGPAIVTPTNPPGLISAEGLSLHARSDGTYLF